MIDPQLREELSTTIKECREINNETFEFLNEAEKTMEEYIETFDLDSDTVNSLRDLMQKTKETMQSNAKLYDGILSRVAYEDAMEAIPPKT